MMLFQYFWKSQKQNPQVSGIYIKATDSLKIINKSYSLSHNTLPQAGE